MRSTRLADDLTMVWMLHPNRIWAASPDGIVLHWDGVNRLRLSTGMQSRLNALWGGDTIAGGDLWIGGEDDLLLWHAEPPAVLPLIERE